MIGNEQRVNVARLRAALADVKATLPARDELILAMRYEDGAKIVDIGRTLGIEQRVLYRHVDAIHARIRDALTSMGLGTDVLGWFEAHT